MKVYTKSYKLNRININIDMERFLPGFFVAADEGEATKAAMTERVNTLSPALVAAAAGESNSLTSCGNALFKQLYLACKRRKEATFSSPGKQKATIETESLVSCKLQSNRFLRNK
jgi:hypothetical protein